jgi:hypothetical protein
MSIIEMQYGVIKMRNLEIFDPAMCCETGVCGADVDVELPRFAADVEWLRSCGVSVERFNLAQQPAEFVSRPVVADALNTGGNSCLPLILLDGQVVSRGMYPIREQLAAIAGLSIDIVEPPTTKSLRKSIPVVQTPCCETDDSTGCC